jgi:hypothetical protein
VPVKAKTNLFSNLNRFIETKARKPIWAFGWAVFAVAFWFAIDFHVSARERLADFNRHRVVIDKQSLDVKLLLKVNEALSEALLAAESATQFHKDHLANLTPADRLPGNLLDSGARLASEARSKLAKAIGTINGSEFSNDQLQRYAAGLKATFSGVDRSVAILERFFQEYSSKGPEPAIQTLKAADTWIFTDAADAVAGFTRLRSWGEMTVLTLDDQLAELTALEAGLSSFAFRFWVGAAAALYCGLFVSCALHSWRGSSRKR